jgi:hypothetical protein
MSTRAGDFHGSIEGFAAQIGRRATPSGIETPARPQASRGLVRI